MALYDIGRRVYCKSQGRVGVVTEANYGHGGPRSPGSHKANYVVAFNGEDKRHWKRYDYMTDSSDLRAVDYYCDGCGKPCPGRPHATAPDGEYPNGLSFCFLCSEVSP